MADLDIDNALLYGDYDLDAHDPLIFWETQFNGLIKITDMDTNHIENTLKMLERKDMQDHPSYFALVMEYENRIREILAE